MKKFTKKISKKSIMILILFFMGYIFFIGALTLFAPKEEIVKADWGVTTFVYWLFCCLLWLGIKIKLIFDGAVHVLIEQSSKKFRE